MGQACVHCGVDCGKYPVIWDEKPFCCHGCKTVYQILNEKKLAKYYEIQSMPGIKIDQTELDDKYAFLDIEEIIEKLLEFSDGGYSKVTLFIPTIHCASCIWLLENLHTLHAGILHAAVNFPQKKVSITFKQSEISLRKIVELLASIHYVPEITLEQLDEKKKGYSDRTLLIKIGIAGFSLLNVMLYNLPEYLPGSHQLSPLFVKFFGWMSLLLAIPVVFYCANDYYLSAIKGIKHKIINIDVPISLGILTLFFQSIYDVFTSHGIGYMDSLVGLVFFLLIGKWYQGKSYQALSFERDYKSYFPVAVSRVVDGRQRESVPLSKLKKDDVIFIRNQELVPTDALLLSDYANIDYSFVTGESIPIEKRKGELIYAGGRQMGSSIQLEVVKTVEQSYLTQLWNQDKTKDSSASSLDNTINKVSQYFTFIVLIIAASAGLFWLFRDASLSLFAFTSVLIIACPCALALTVPFTFGSTMRAFGRNGFYIKNTGVVESLNKIQTIVFDKTGTITQNHSMKLTFVGDVLTKEQQKIIQSLTVHSSHPLSYAISKSIGEDDLYEVTDFSEIPSMGISGIVKGKRVNVGSRKFVLGKADDKANNTSVYIFLGEKVLGHYQIENQYRPGLQEIVNNLKSHYQLYLLSGDNEAEKENLKKIFGSKTELHFNQSPNDKMSFVRKLKESGQKVLMIGDGLNDAGALIESHVGLTIADDIYNFSPACDGIIEAAQFAKLHRFIAFTKKSMTVVWVSFLISFLYNVVGIYFAVQGQMSPLVAAILMPISSVSVVAFASLSINALSKEID